MGVKTLAVEVKCHDGTILHNLHSKGNSQFSTSVDFIVHTIRTIVVGLCMHVLVQMRLISFYKNTC